MPRARALLLTGEEYTNIRNAVLSGESLNIPKQWVSQNLYRGGNGIYDGDACVVNDAILESGLGQQLNVAFLPDTYAQGDGSIPENATECVLYQAASTAHGSAAKINALEKVYKQIKDEKDRSHCRQWEERHK